MRLNTFALVLGLGLVLLSAAASADGNGDVTIKVNPPAGGNAWFGMNQIEIWIRNDAPLYGMSIGLKLDCPGIPLSLSSTYGNVPRGGPIKYVQEWGDAYGVFDPEGLQVTVNALSNTVLIQGTTSTDPLPVHTVYSKCYDLRLYLQCGGELGGQLSIDNVYLEPDGVWMFDDGTQYAPTFQGQPNTSMTIPDAPAAIFPVTILPCMPPYFTTTPNPVETASHCSDFKFTFGAQDSKCGKGALEFSSSVGNMNPTTGEFTLLPDPTCGTTVVTAIVTNIACLTDEFAFTIDWVDAPVTLTNCPAATGYIDPDNVYEYPFSSACDNATFEVAPVEGPPEGSFDVDPTGKFVFTPTLADNEHLYAFDLFANSSCGARDTCRFTVAVGATQCGDPNGDMVADISDVVFLISYIFQGGLQPNPLLRGDANCDTTVDISDVVCLLSYIFSGGFLPCTVCP
ncbi:MAG: hypothetical protein E4G91_06260 [Candidatus Zixiibacteriota bacterium]|nr:MAG: hypothetical protein E4G91_06260 [candidate division Zixibacteria bacterium]